MADRLKETSRFAGWRYAVWVFIKAQLSSYVASLVDFLVTILLVKLSGLFYLYATFLGSVVGGMVNCAINYGWVFHADDCKKTHVALKYLFVWGGSILLNTWGTFALTEWLTGMRWVDGLLGHYINRTDMNYRDWLQQLIYKIINPVVHGMIKVGITPNFITTTGLVMNIVAACVFVYAGMYKPGELVYVGWGGGIVLFGGRNDLAIVGWAGGVILFAGLFDMMDGRVARLGNMSSKFGALYDSVLDRYSEMVTLFGVFYYLILQGYLWGSMITFVALVGSLMVSYVRARAEGLGLECKVGFMQRPERVVLTSLGALFCGIFSDCEAFDPMLILIVPMVVIAVLANLTAFARIEHCYKLLKKQ